MNKKTSEKKLQSKQIPPDQLISHQEKNTNPLGTRDRTNQGRKKSPKGSKFRPQNLKSVLDTTLMAEEEIKDYNLCRAEFVYELQNSKSKSEGTIWDCDSTLYDSFELRSFSFQLSRALTVVASSNPPDASLRPKAGSCFRSILDRRNVEEIDSKSDFYDPKRKSLASWSLKKLVGAFHRKSKDDKIL